jgi:restriction system protein
VVTIDVRHDGLGRLERVSAPTQGLAEQRAAALKARWDEDFKARATLSGPAADALGKLQADERTAAAERAVHALTAILIDSLRVAPATDWSPLIDTAPFAEAAPVPPPPPQAEPEPKREDFPREPLTLATLINPRALRRRRETAAAKFETAHSGWTYLTRWRESEYEKVAVTYRAALSDWGHRETAFLERQARANARLDALVAGYRAGEAEAVIGHCDLNLLSLDRPDGFPRFWTMRYDNGVLEIDYDLPSMEVVPVVKAVKYVPSRRAFDTAVLPERERERLYGEAVFQTALAVLHTLFTGDAAGALKAIAFNGWANYIDGAALRPGRACILSVTTAKELFQGIDLASVDPQACFRALNGTMSAKLAALVTHTA